MEILKSTGKEMVDLFGSYFAEKIGPARGKFEKRSLEFQKSVPFGTHLFELTDPVETETDDLIANMARLVKQPPHETQKLIFQADDKIFGAFLIRCEVVTGYFIDHPNEVFAHSDYYGQFVLDYLTNYWRWIKEQPDDLETP